MLLGGCTPDVDADDYEVENIGQIAATQKGVVVYRRDIKMNFTPQGQVDGGATTGAAVGGYAGAAGGAAAGGDIKSAAGGAILGAVAGSLLGYGVNQATRTRPGFEYHIKLEKTEEIIVVTQGKKPEINVGDKVLLITPKEDPNVIKTSDKFDRAKRTRIVPINY